MKLLALPRDVGTHPETGLMIQAGIGRFGPFLKHADKFTSLPKDDDVLFVGMNRAVEVLALAAEKAAKREAEGKKPFTRRKAADKKQTGKKKSGGKRKRPQKIRRG